MTISGPLRSFLPPALLAAALLAGFFSLPSAAASPVSRTEPVRFSADELGYDRKEAVVLAVGNVEVMQGDTILLADRISYHQNSNMVSASGNVSVLEPSGNVYFADNVELKDDLKEGVVRDFRARLKDNSLFAAREARKIGEKVTELRKAVYSPCHVCEEDEKAGHAPLWQIKADKVTYDEAAQRITYRDAWFEVYGAPVLYTPYLSHATPDAASESGLMLPRYAQSSLLGTVVEVPVYLSFASNIDATLTPIYTSQEGMVLAGEYRHLVEDGYFEFKGSVTDPGKRDDAGNLVAGKNEVRGHVEAKGGAALGDVWNWGFDVKRATDDTYLQRYRFSDEDTLTSRAFVEGMDGRSYAALEGLSFQGLRLTDDPDRTPLILPLGEAHYETAPLWMNSRALLDGNVMALTRDTGAESRRLSMTGGWRLPYVTAGGQLFEAAASLRGDAYSVEEAALAGGGEFSGEVGRAIPQLELLWRYPLIRPLENGGSLILEPEAGAAVSPRGVNSGKIPNEDSLALEFSDSNLFSSNPFPGLDRVETGPRASYGLRGQWQMEARRNLQFLFGQHVQANDDSRFPYTNNSNEDLSDYVGRLGAGIDALDLAYRFRLDRDGFSPKRHEVNALFDWSPVFLAADYIKLEKDPFLADREEIYAATALELSENWTFTAGARRDLSDGDMIRADGGLRFQNECMAVYTDIKREFTRDRDIEPATAVSVRLSLKNLN